MTVTFCGHAQFYGNPETRRWLVGVADALISEGADTFLLGGYGGFDRFAAGVMQGLKKTYPHIKIVLVLAYLNRNECTDGYDYTLYPELEDVPLRFAISKRNERMVEMSDAVVAYVTHDWGGAAKTLKYARRKKKTVYCYPDEKKPLENQGFPRA